jgi:hypothetical protein
LVVEGLEEVVVELFCAETGVVAVSGLKLALVPDIDVVKGLEGVVAVGIGVENEAGAPLLPYFPE